MNVSKDNINNIVESIEKLTAGQIFDLVTELEEKWGVKADAVAAAPAASGDGSKAEEKSVFQLVLDSAGAKKVNVIKALRAIKSELSLMEAKKIADADGTVIGEFSKEDAEKHQKALVDAGAKASVK